MGYVPAKKEKAKFTTGLACMVPLMVYDIRIHGFFRCKARSPSSE